MVTDRSTCFAQGNALGVGGRIGVGDVAIEAASNDLALVDHDRTDGDFSRLKRTPRGAQGFLHPEFVGLKLAGSRSIRGVLGHSWLGDASRACNILSCNG